MSDVTSFRDLDLRNDDLLPSDPGNSGGTRYYGKYRATVVQNNDPEGRGRIMAEVTDAKGFFPSTWAMPCMPMAGIQAGAYMVPPIGAGVWLEFEQGNPDFPIWSGCWWGSRAEVPPLAMAGLTPTPNIVLQTMGQNTLVISDLPGAPGTPGTGITLKTKTGAMIVVNDAGILISNGKGASILMQGNTVMINGGALSVM